RLAGEHVVQRHLRKEVEDDVEVGEAEVGVEHEHALAALGERRRQVGRDEGLADAALAAGDREDPARCAHARRPWNCEVPNSRPFSSGLTYETAGCSRQARAGPSDLAR